VNPPILNRDFQHPADGWYNIEPKGEFPNSKSGVVQIIDDVALESIANRFSTEAANPNFAGLLIDHEHFRHQTDQESRAYGWLMKVQNRADGLYGQIRWTATGKAAVDGGDYRFFSSEYFPNDLTVLNREGSPRRVRPMRLGGLTLTNDPNNKGAKPITNRREEPTPADKSKQQSEHPIMKSVAHILGLAPEASESAVLEAVQVVLNRAAAVQATLDKTKTRLAEVETQVKQHQADRVNDVLNRLDAEPIKNRVTDAERASFRQCLEASFDAGRVLVDGFIAKIESTAAGASNTAAPRTPITNRQQARTPGAATPETPKDEKSKAAIFNRKVSEYKAQHRVSHVEADRAVAELHPELLPSADATE
jgi:phage I-like protein